MIVVPIIAAAGFQIPKTSSRAITSPAGTADTMEVLSPVTFIPRQIERLVDKVGGCIVWGGHLGLAPADDNIIQVEAPLAFESFDKIIVSIMAKKVASGATHLVLDIPVGKTMKIQHMKDANLIRRKFTLLADRFGIKIHVDINEIRQNAGRGIGALLEARDVMQVLEQHPERAIPLEDKAIRLAGELISLCNRNSSKKIDKPGSLIAREMLTSGKALAKMREIIHAQGGNPLVSSLTLHPSHHAYELKAHRSGVITNIDNQHITVICRILGCPSDKKAGIYLNTKIGEKVDKNDILCTLYSSDDWMVSEAKDTLKSVELYEIE